MEYCDLAIREGDKHTVEPRALDRLYGQEHQQLKEDAFYKAHAKLMVDGGEAMKGEAHVAVTAGGGE